MPLRYCNRNGGCEMVSQEQLDSLKTKHAGLEKAIDEEAHRPLPDTVQIHTLKREKLKINDEITRLSRSYISLPRRAQARRPRF